MPDARFFEPKIKCKQCSKRFYTVVEYSDHFDEGACVPLEGHDEKSSTNGDRLVQ